MQITVASEADYERIYELVKAAFESAAVSDGTEQDYVEQMRAGDNFLPELEFVAWKDGEMIGHIMLNRQTVKTSEGMFEGLLITALCVRLEKRGMGVGSALMRHALEQADKLGYTAAFLLGNPEYYKRFGFARTGVFGIRNATKVPDPFVLGCEIREGALKDMEGEIRIV